MKNIPKPKFEKVDDNTIRIIVEEANDVPLAKILENRDKLLAQKKQMRKDLAKQEEYIDQALKNIEEILTQAVKLGIFAKLKPTEPKPPAIRKLKEGSDKEE